MVGYCVGMRVALGLSRLRRYRKNGLGRENRPLQNLSSIMAHRVTELRTPRQGDFARRFFLVSLMVFGVAAALAFLLIEYGGPLRRSIAMLMPLPFWFSSVLLATGSGFLQRSLGYVRIERQGPFRRCLLRALVAGTLFVGVQSYGLWCLKENQDPARVVTGSNAFIFVFAFLHAMHLIVALLFLVFVTLQGLADRYDHEYYWGVTVCTYFWHLLVVVWIFILAVFVISW